MDTVPDHLAALNEMRDRLDITLDPLHPAVTPWVAASAALVLLTGVATSLAVRRRRANKAVVPNR